MLASSSLCAGRGLAASLGTGAHPGALFNGGIAFRRKFMLWILLALLVVVVLMLGYFFLALRFDEMKNDIERAALAEISNLGDKRVLMVIAPPPRR